MPTKQAESSTYQSYLLRFWRNKPTDSWRVSLQSTATEELRHFAKIEELWAFFDTELTVGSSFLAEADQTTKGTDL